MRVPRLYCEARLGAELPCRLSDERHHYLVRVLRAAVGDDVDLFNGDGRVYRYRLESADKKQARLTYQSDVAVVPESSCRIHLYLAVTKSQSIGFAIQKAVELGVYSIHPLITQYANYKLANAKSKLEHWQSIVRSGVEQCGRAVIPTVHKPAAIADVQTPPQTPLQTECIALDLAAETGFAGALRKSRNADLCLMIGPEGGFSDTDRLTFKQCGFSSANLGPRILRTETAVIAALTLAQAIKGDLGAD